MDHCKYKQFMNDFGAKEIDEKLLERIEKLTKQPLHKFLKRHFYFCHKDLDTLMDLHEKVEKFYIYTGRGCRDFI